LQGATRDSLAQQLLQLRANEFKAAKTTAERQMADLAFEEALLFFKDVSRPDDSIPLQESIAQAKSRLHLRIMKLESSNVTAEN